MVLNRNYMQYLLVEMLGSTCVSPKFLWRSSSSYTIDQMCKLHSSKFTSNFVA